MYFFVFSLIVSFVNAFPVLFKFGNATELLFGCNNFGIVSSSSVVVNLKKVVLLSVEFAMVGRWIFVVRFFKWKCRVSV